MSTILSRTLYPNLPSYPERVIQFGDGNFLRAFTVWQVQQMNNQNLFEGSVVMVKTLASPRNEHFDNQDHLYTVLLNGIMDEQTVRKPEIMSCISRIVDPYSEYERFLALAEQNSLEFITSNTTEAGIAYDPKDRLDDGPQSSFPGKLTALLYRRFQLGKKGFTIIPCELIDRNGEQLRDIVLRYAADWNLGTDFIRWTQQENTFCCSLVDRIVPGFPHDTVAEWEQELGYSDRLMVTAEPYLLWVIEGPEEVAERLPLRQAGVNAVFTQDMTLYRERKVHLLNAPHTAMAALGLLAGISTVEETMTDPDFSVYVKQLLEDELIPMLDLPKPELEEYARTVRERFLNPFIRHELASISLNSVSKFKARLLPILLRYQQERGELPKLITLALAALLLAYRGDRLERKDNPEVLALFDEAWQQPENLVPSILQKSELWGEDLTNIPGLTARLKEDIQQLDALGARAVIQKTGGEIPCND
ncbi:tagaturonate reductase [Paenibacillus senegalimassiliensis]|uniref:tagaturonate reductase n=1 Tax=Paenibacillus senegalimassiliensis TaxID=1737426 RepID=UPI00073EA4CE|nr:tagaturonate reductase [Paenibacillus senegalimassiliensis]